MTLPEMLVAVAGLVIVLLIAGRLFAVTATVARRGHAAANVLREVAVIERRLRRDFEHLSPDGVLAIRCVAVPNDIHDPIGRSVLLDPNRPPGAMIRADQLLYFTNALEAPRVLRPGHGLNCKPRAVESRVYFGHAYQIGDAAPPVEVSDGTVWAWDVTGPCAPWRRGPLDLARTRYTGPAGATNMFERTGTTTIRFAPRPVQDWLLVRQPVLLVDDDVAPPASNRKTVFLDQVLAARSIFRGDPGLPDAAGPVFGGRVDAAATTIDDARRILRGSDPEPRPWRDAAVPIDQYRLVTHGLLGYPRAERAAPSLHRTDVALTTSVIGSACSSVIIEWTWNHEDGFDVDDDAPVPWFGLADPGRGVAPYGAGTTWRSARSIDPATVESIRHDQGIEIYEAVFAPVPVGVAGAPVESAHEGGTPPWPNRIRITLTLHDARTQLGAGRTVQFVFEVPTSTRGRSAGAAMR